MTCNNTFIRRIAYTTKNNVYVPSKCIKDRGLPGKGPKILPKLKQGTLEGYSTKKSDLSRHRALLKHSREKSKSTVIKKLNAVKILTKNTSPKTSKKIQKDIKYLQKTTRV
jgi:hypothetical protein